MALQESSKAKETETSVVRCDVLRQFQWLDPYENEDGENLEVREIRYWNFSWRYPETRILNGQHDEHVRSHGPSRYTLLLLCQGKEHHFPVTKVRSRQIQNHEYLP